MIVRFLSSIALGLTVALSALAPAGAEQSQPATPSPPVTAASTTAPPPAAKTTPAKAAPASKAKHAAHGAAPAHAKGATNEVGWASWYGKAHQGHKTAGGTTFDKEAMVAAHRTLPMGSKARITNLSNGKSIDVEVVDRGPVRRDRVIDLSESAARAIDMKNAGVAKVLVEPLPGDPTLVQTATGD
jgi:rare lipoprotein A